MPVPGQSQNAKHDSTDVPIGWFFFRQWLKDPFGIAALSPSSRQLARQMIAELPHKAERVIELGGGTGVFTRALLEHGIKANDLFVLELNEALYEHLRANFNDVQLVCGDARKLDILARDAGFLDGGHVDAIISGLGLLPMSHDMQAQILHSAFATLRPDGRFIQFTYGPKSPVSRELLNELGLSVRRAGIAWFNMPPATVYVYTRNPSRGVNAVRRKASDS